MPKRLASSIDHQAVELPLSIFTTWLFVMAVWKIGLVPSLFALLLVGSVLLGLSTPRGFAVLVLVLAPLPSIGQLVGASIPLGLDPLDVLVVVGIGLAAQKARPLVLGPRGRAVVALAVINLGVLVIAWYRTYGQSTITGSSLALILKPTVVVLAGFAVIRLLPRDQLLDTLGAAMGGALLLIAFSVVLQRIGLYRTAHQDAYASILGAKQYGGLMLDGNSAGAMLGIFTIPTFVLLRTSGRKLLASLVVLVSVPVMLITLSRSGILAFAAGLVVLALTDRARLRGARVALLTLMFAAIWAMTLGRSQFGSIVDTVAGYSQDPNASLSGRPAIWNQAVNFLTDGHQRWIVGGGLDSFRTYALASPLQHAFATHNVLLRLLTNGGVVMAAVFALLVVALLRVGFARTEPPAQAMKIAVVASLALGVAIDFDYFSRLATWIWVMFFAAVAYAAPADSTAATMRSAIAGTLQGRSGARIASRTSADAERDT